MAGPTRRWARHLCLAWLAAGGGAAPALATSIDLAGLQDAAAAAHWDTEKLYAACTRLALAPWPAHPASRRAYLQRLDGIKASCMSHPQFLATLGALWLEEGEPSQALIWLERALLLDAGHLGALADHALALAALGQPAARDALALEWRSRADVPAVLRERLSPHAFSATAPLPAVRLGGKAEGDWASYRELSVLGGYESNLDQSPKLAEITLTPPGGSIDVPLGKPLAPRRGAALSTELSWQIASSPSTGRIVRAGVNMGTRVSPAESDTNWRHVQLAGSVSQLWLGWRGQVDLGGAWVAGALNEPYRILRTGISLERTALGCGFRLSLDGESRSQSQTVILDGRAVAVSASTQCALWGKRHWTWGLALRTAMDRPVDPERAGGAQHFSSVGLRLQGALPAQARLDASLRLSRVHDRDGYSPLLDNNARRKLAQSQFSLELSKPLDLANWGGLEAVVQLSAVHQNSNLSLFRFDSVSLYGGLRWAW